MDIDQNEYDRIAELIHSDSSPVGIDARKTHVLILQLLQKIDARLDEITARLDSMKE